MPKGPATGHVISRCYHQPDEDTGRAVAGAGSQGRMADFRVREIPKG